MQSLLTKQQKWKGGLCLEVKFHRDVNHNYMMLLSGETPNPDAYENRVILANRIRGLLPCRLLYLNGDTYYSYDITSMQSLEILRGRRILSGEGLSGFLSELIDVLGGLEEYLLCFDHLILTPDKIFIDPSGGKIGLVYCPVYRKDIRESLRELIEYLLSGTDPEDRRTTLLLYRVYHALQKEELLLGELPGLFSEFGNESENPERPGRSRFPGMDGMSSGQKGYAGMPDERIADRAYAEKYHGVSESGRAEYESRAMESFGEGRKRRFFARSGPDCRKRGRKGAEAVYEGPLWDTAGNGRAKAARRETGNVRMTAIIVFLSVGLLSAAVTYSFLHLGLGRIFAEHSDFVIRIGGACAVVALFAAAFYFFGKNRKMKTRSAGMPEDEVSRYEDDGFFQYGTEDFPKADFREAREDPQDEDMDSFKDPDRGTDVGEIHEGELTCLLRKEQKAPELSARLVSEEDKEESGGCTEIPLGEGTVIIGKSGELSDRVISMATVSRVHARIRFSEGEYYIMDLNSRNGTFVNGELLPGGEEVKISDGDGISFADAVYRFRK